MRINYPPDLVFNDELACFLVSVNITSERDIHLYLGGVCAMSGAISLASRILPTAQHIFTYNDGVPDTGYVRRPDLVSVARDVMVGDWISGRYLKEFD